MRLLLALILTGILTGCVSGDDWHVQATVSEPHDAHCSTSKFGRDICQSNDKSDKESSHSLVHKATGLDDPIDLVSYVGVSVGLSW